MRNKLFIASLAAAVMVPAIVAPIPTTAHTTSFTDTGSLDQTTKEKIEKLVEMNVISGFHDGSFRPYEPVTRGQYASFISRALNLPNPKNPESFMDVTKKVATYDGILKAYDSKIINGYPDGRFRPDELITRGDMSIMLDNALQLNGSHSTKANLTYSDKNSIGKKSYEAVQRLTHYNIIGPHTGNSFKANEKGDRLTTVLSIYELLKVKGLLDQIVEEPEKEVTYPKEDPRNLTYEEIKTRVGEWKIIERDGRDGSIIERDLVQEYYDDIRDPITGKANRNRSPEKVFEGIIEDLNYTHTTYAQAFPKYEMISLNGVPYRYTEYFPEHLKKPQLQTHIRMSNLVAAPPKENGNFLIDIPVLNNDIVTYRNNDIGIKKADVKPVETKSKDFLVDLKGVFENADMVNVSNDGLTIKYQNNIMNLKVGSNVATLNGKNITLADNVETKNGVVVAPIQSVAKNLGLSTRKMRPVAYKIEVANYELPVSLTDTKLDGWE